MPTKQQRQRRRRQRMYDHPRRKRHRRPKSNARRRRPRLRFTPTAWAKLLYLRDAGPTEVGGFGITPADDLLLVEEFVLVPQSCSEVTVAFDDEAVADFFEQQVDQGRQPQQFARIWLHTHPGSSATLSGVDEETFERVFGRCDWAAMFILAQAGQTHAELSWQPGGGARIGLDVEIDYSRSFAASDIAAWEAEYTASVRPEHPWCSIGADVDARDLADLDAGFFELAATDLTMTNHQHLITETL